MSYDAKVYAHFYPDKSWVIKEQSSEHILNHEQLHFDITELHARKFRKQLSTLKVSNSIRAQLQAMHNEIVKEKARLTITALSRMGRSISRITFQGLAPITLAASRSELGMP